MIRFFVAVLFMTGVWLSFGSESFGQSTDEDQFVPPKGDLGWCTVTSEAGAGNSECGFESAAAACERQITSFYPKGRRVFAGTRSETTTSALCNFRTKPEIIELIVGIAGVSKRCESGYTRAGATCRVVYQCSTCDPTQEAGNPINFVTGEKKDVRVDYKSADGRFVIKRHYNSSPFSNFGAPTNMAKVFGQSWYLGNLPILSATTSHAPSFVYYNFSYSTGYSTQFRGQGEPRGLVAAGDARSPFVVRHPDGPVGNGETGDRRVSIVHNNGTEYNYNFPLVTGLALRGVVEKPNTVDYGEGYIHAYAYDDDGNLTTITDSFGRQASFQYHVNEWRVPNGSEQDFVVDGVPYDGLQYEEDGQEVFREAETGLLKRITFPDGTYSEFIYDAVSEFNQYWGVKERLKKVVKYSPERAIIRTETYHYEDTRLPFALTGITDDAGIRFATWSYDEEGRANMSEHAGGVDRVDVEYETAANTRVQTTRMVTNALGHTKTYTIDNAVQDLGITKMEGEGTADVKPTQESYFYATGGGKTFIRDSLSRDETRSINSRGFPLSKTYARGTSEEFTKFFTWHPRFKRPTQTIEPGLTTDYVYDVEGRILSMTQTDTTSTPAPPREWTYTWSGSNLAMVDGPLPGAVDVTTFEHVNEKLTRVVNELGHETNITSHNDIGAPARFTDPNGVVTDLEYDARHRLTQISRAGALTQIRYTPTDLTKSITLPNGNQISFEYNDGRQLIAITNGEDERVEYVRNAMGGILSTRIPDSSNMTQYSMALARDEINRVIQATGVNSVTAFAYDEMNNLTDITDPRNNTWQQNYDNLDRLTEEIDPLGGTTDYTLNDQMDARNPLSKVTDQRGVETNFVRNGYGEVIREVSLEAGTTEYLRDQAGRIKQMTDARGVISTYSYDGMDRLLAVSYPAAPEDDITYGYDQGALGIGELTSITESFGTTTYGYNDLAQMVRMTRDISGVPYVCEFEYDLAGEVTAIVYPSGRRIEYSRDDAARETQIRMVAPDGTATILADGISYKPFGPIDAMSLGDGHDLSINYDRNYRATRLQRSGAAGSLMDLGFTYDVAGDITGLQDNLRPERSQILGYDALSRLTSATGGYGSIDYGYNPGGDRTSRSWTEADGTVRSETYSYDAMTARLLEVSNTDAGGQMTPIREFDYHASGQVSSDQRGPNAYLYGLNARGRMNSVTRNGESVADYTYDESEQRIVKTADGKTIHYHYDLDGRLISETDGVTGDPLRDYVWLGLMPIAVIDATEDAPDTACEEEIAALDAQIADRTTRIDNNAARIPELFDLITDKENRIATNAARITELEALSADKAARIAANSARITELGDLVTDKQSRITANADRIDVLTASIADKDSRIAANAARIGELTTLIAADEAEAATLDPVADAARITLLTDRITTRADRVTTLTTRNAEMTALNATQATRITELTTRNAELSALITDHETRSAELTTRNAELSTLRDAHDTRAVELTTRNDELAALNTAHETRIDELSARNLVLAEQRIQLEADLAEAQANCETVPAEGLYYLHADHLGRPQFATDTSGAVVWDMGGDVTPFGDSVNLAGAFAQQLMFPGQYVDLETGGEGDDVTLSHNWHRTYDPTLGRYLQSDPIGLAGGLNRFAYVGGNPVSLVDPLGLSAITFSDYVSIIGGEVRTKPLRGKNPFYIGGVAAGAALAIIYYNTIVYEDPVISDDDCAADETEDTSKERLITHPPRRKGHWSAICRVDDQGLTPSKSGLPFAVGTGIAKDMTTARRMAEKEAKDLLGSSNVHHPSCKCTGPKGERNNCGR
ncbi:MAG: RHS repeat-associated core domain-containing protein [Litorimonas sp.]